MKRLILVGGGHAHLFVLERLIRQPEPALEVCLVTPNRWQYYSGMIPGWILGQYRLEQCRIDLQGLAGAAGVTLVRAAVVNFDATRRCIGLSDGQSLSYDRLSLDVGSESDCRMLASLGARLVGVKPIDELARRWPGLIEEAATQASPRWAVVGAGPAGIELALAAHHCLKTVNPKSTLQLFAGERGVLPIGPDRARRWVEGACERAGVEIVMGGQAVGHEQGIRLIDGTIVPVDRVLAATSSRPAPWIARSGLLTDRAGFIVVDQHHRSQSHPEVSAAGDVCARPDEPLERSGVHAVRAGPVLAHNLLAECHQQPLKSFHPSARTLSLLACPGRRAVAVWGRWSAAGAWVWRWKDVIDRRFIRHFVKLERHHQ